MWNGNKAVHLHIRADPNDSKLLLPLLPWLSMSNRYLKEGVMFAALEKVAKNWWRVRNGVLKHCTESAQILSFVLRHHTNTECNLSMFLCAIVPMRVTILIFAASVLNSISFCRYLSRSSASWSLCVSQNKTSSASSLSCSSTRQLYPPWLR